MFAYSDPTGTGTLEQAGALQIYRELIDRFYKRFHDVQDSAFTLLEAFAEASPADQVQTTAQTVQQSQVRAARSNRRRPVDRGRCPP